MNNQLLIKKAIIGDEKQEKYPIKAWVDYKKTTDSNNYIWIIKCWEIYTMPFMIAFIRKNMMQQKTTIKINQNDWRGNYNIHIDQYQEWIF